MIEGFEEYTQELSDYERDVLLPVLIRGMKLKIGKKKAVTNDKAIYRLKDSGYKISAPRFRKILHIIRVSGMVSGIVANSKGYYIANTDIDFQRYLKSLDDRIYHVQTLRDAIQDQYEKFKNKI